MCFLFFFVRAGWKKHVYFCISSNFLYLYISFYFPYFRESNVERFWIIFCKTYITWKKRTYIYFPGIFCNFRFFFHFKENILTVSWATFCWSFSFCLPLFSSCFPTFFIFSLTFFINATEFLSFSSFFSFPKYLSSHATSSRLIPSSSLHFLSSSLSLLLYLPINHTSTFLSLSRTLLSSNISLNDISSLILFTSLRLSSSFPLSLLFLLLLHTFLLIISTNIDTDHRPPTPPPSTDSDSYIRSMSTQYNQHLFFLSFLFFFLYQSIAFVSFPFSFLPFLVIFHPFPSLIFHFYHFFLLPLLSSLSFSRLRYAYPFSSLFFLSFLSLCIFSFPFSCPSTIDVFSLLSLSILLLLSSPLNYNYISSSYTPFLLPIPYFFLIRYFPRLFFRSLPFLYSMFSFLFPCLPCSTIPYLSFLSLLPGPLCHICVTWTRELFIRNGW